MYTVGSARLRWAPADPFRPIVLLLGLVGHLAHTSPIVRLPGLEPGGPQGVLTPNSNRPGQRSEHDSRNHTARSAVTFHYNALSVALLAKL